MSKLLIIGNGFDLQAGLASSYADFFKYRIDSRIENYLLLLEKNYKSNTSNGGSPYDCITFKKDTRNSSIKLSTTGPRILNTSYQHLSFWDLVFFYSNRIENEPNFEWHNIEENINLFLHNKGKATCKDSFVQQHTASLSNLCSVVFYSHFETERWTKFDNCYDFLFAELNLLEKEFNKYLITKLETTSSYKQDSTKLIHKLFKMESSTHYSGYFDILNFNYTEPFKYNMIRKTNSNRGGIFSNISNISYNNIHGKLSDNNIIFGIDPKGINTKSVTYMFTKTFRQMIGDFLISSKSNNLLRPQEHHEIVFYGHSLSSLDYSYFQAIFDCYKLYSSHIKLVFYYSIYDSNRANEIKLDMVNKVMNLIESYASTLENPDHSGNLISKLIIEGRLTIEELKP